ncbi:MAG TPA: hypothetical protein DCP08_00165 [Chloroflexi bacterium]|nr:hypothetical protein [Chloroflexota bacterium]
MPGLLSRWLEKAQKKMALHKPKSFPTHHHYAAFFDARDILFKGDDMAILEYPDQKTQEEIFHHVVSKFDLQGNSILDVGCGLGYLKGYLDRHYPDYASYLGIDLSDHMVAGAQERFGKGCFIKRDILVDPFFENQFDISFLISVLGYPVGPDPEAYMKGLLKELFRISGCGIGFTHLAPHRREEPSDFTYDPQALKEWCCQVLSPHVVLDDTLGQVTYVIAVYKGIPT